MDRQVISYLKPFFCSGVTEGGFGWTNSDYSYVTSFFTISYAIMTVFIGWVIDKIGTKLGLTLSLITWSFFGMINAFAGANLAIHIFIRSMFGLGEAANFPASNKTVAEWFPKKERALATGIFNSGTNIGAMISALFVPWCLTFFGTNLGWKMSFLLTGGIGFFWLIFWVWLYNSPNKQKRLDKEEYRYIHQDDPSLNTEPKGDVAIPWFNFFSYRQTWSFFWGKLLTDGVWWFYLFWLPDYLIKQFGMNPVEVTWPIFFVYCVSISGNILGGGAPLYLINKGMSVYKARMTTLLIIALLPLPVLTIQFFGNTDIFGSLALYFSVAIISFGAIAHQAWSSNLFTIVSDMFPKSTIASVTGIGNMAGGIGSVMLQLLAGRLTDVYVKTPKTAYSIMFFICALAYITAWTIMKALIPKYKVIELKKLKKEGS